MIFSIILLGGVFQALFGVARLGSLIKHTPQPVMAGFQNAAALLLVLVQLGNVFGFDKSTSFMEALKHASAAKPLSVAIAIVVVVVMWNSRTFLPKVPPVLVGLGVGTILYYACGLAGFGLQLGSTIGSGLFNSYKLPNFPQFGELARSASLLSLLPTIVGGALALAIIASIDALLCAKLLARPGDPQNRRRPAADAPGRRQRDCRAASAASPAASTSAPAATTRTLARARRSRR